jgi:plasmid stabilization system protein ParE
LKPVIGEHPAARAEFLAAVAYYEHQRGGLGAELLNCFEKAIADILESPQAWPQELGGDIPLPLRSHRVERFHFRIVYYVRGQQVRIIAYAHTSREPGYWAQRAEGDLTN